MRGTKRSRRGQGALFELEEPEVRSELYAHVALNRPVRCEFTYAVPGPGVVGGTVARLAPGMRVAVPFGPGREVGVVVGLSRERPAIEGRMRAIARVLDPEPLVGEQLLELTRWMAETYACSWGEALHAVLPAALKRERGTRTVAVISAAPGVGEAELAQIEQTQAKQHRVLRTLLEIGGGIDLRELSRRLNLSDAPAKSLVRRGWARIERVHASDDLALSRSDRRRPERLLESQRLAVEAICDPLARGEHATFLLDGVTGSGKTEVYLAAIERALELGKSAIVLVPEIALTPQTVGWFRSRFDPVAVLHSRLTDAQRYQMWLSVVHGEARVVVGARSAIFAPVADLGIVVVDEEHEPSFKQGSVPRYHARDVAVERARGAGAVCVLGSATPSLESWHAARSGRYRRLSLPERVSGHGFPPIEVVDLRIEPPGPKGSRLFSRRLLALIELVLERGEQAILFQNRRGWAPVLWCRGCKETVRCHSCDVALTWHQRIRRLVCHTCCEERQQPLECPTCTAPTLRYLGAGSERIEQELEMLFPDARVRRMDSDTMRRREDYERTLEAFGRGEIDLLVGTQMIAKGLDFPRVTLVGIVSADGALHLPDFRAAERTFQLISQVAGRAGRGELAGRIVVQTLTPEHPAIRRAAAHDHAGFAEEEGALRAELGYPPHGRLVRALFEDPEEERAADAARACAEDLRARLAGESAVVLGPAPAPMALLRGRHRNHLLVKASPEGRGLELARDFLVVRAAELSRPHLAIDVDPVSLL